MSDLKLKLSNIILIIKVDEFIMYYLSELFI